MMTQTGKYLVICVIMTVTCVHAENCDKLNQYSMKLINLDDVQFFKDLMARAGELEVNMMRPARRMNDDIIFQVSQCKQKDIEGLLNKNHIKDFKMVTVSSQNRRSLKSVQDEKEDEVFKLSADKFDFNIITRRYLWSNEINLYLEKVVELITMRNPNIEAKINVEGFSFQKRPIKSISISYKGKNNSVVVIDAGIHAREWHSRSLALFTIKGLMQEALLDKSGLIFKSTFIIVPDVNPDGYLYSRKVEKMWRKNRRPVNEKCIGVDGNRNYDAHWEMGEHEKQPCQEVYKGKMPFSEPETQAIRNLLTKVKSQAFLYISIHTYGNSILFPNGWTIEHHARHKQLLQIANAGATAATSLYGSKFTADQSGSGLYVAAGGSDDWAIETLNIPFCYTFEIGAESYGFQVPENKLKQTVEEGWIAIRAMTIEALSLI